MWVRKSDQQMAKENKDRNRVGLSFSGPALLFIICFFATIGIEVQGRRGLAWTAPAPWPDILFRSTAIGTVAAILGYIVQLVLQRRILVGGGGHIVICNTCYRVKHLDSKISCECGGVFEEFDKWTWIDD